MSGLSDADGKQGGANGAAPTLANAVYESLKEDILSADLLPGTKLRVEFVCQRYGMGTSPVREALTRLAGEGFVKREENRGFFVAAVSADELRELTETRCWLEEIALRRSIEFGTEAWEENLVLAFHRFSRLERPPSGTAFRPNTPWVQRHNAFHDALIGACGSRWLLEFCAHMRDQAYRFRRITSEERTGTAVSEHEAIMKAALARDVPAAVGLLTQHYRNTADIALRRQPAPAAAKKRR